MIRKLLVERIIRVHRQIVERLKKYKLFHAVWLEKGYIEKGIRHDVIDHALQRNGVLVLNHYGEKNKGRIILNIKNNDSAMGFFAAWKMMIMGISLADELGLTPVCSWTKKGPYFDPEHKGTILNPFEYYFEQISNVSVKDMKESHSVANYYFGQASFEFNLCQGYGSDIDDVGLYAKYCGRMPLKGEILEALNDDISNVFGNHKILAVHIRGVDWGNIKSHPIPLSLDKYKKMIDKALDMYDFSKIFIACDSEDTRNYFQQIYNERLIFFNDVSLAERGTHTLAIFNDRDKKGGFQLGYEVLRDMYAMSMCDGLIAGLSSVSLASLAYKKSRNENFIYLNIIKNKIQTGGITSIEAADRERKGLL